ncbi:MAG: hypothetical protein AAF195_03090 [Pseudomonadota bacterium]
MAYNNLYSELKKAIRDGNRNKVQTILDIASSQDFRSLCEEKYEKHNGFSVKIASDFQKILKIALTQEYEKQGPFDLGHMVYCFGDIDAGNGFEISSEYLLKEDKEKFFYFVYFRKDRFEFRTVTKTHLGETIPDILLSKYLSALEQSNNIPTQSAS